MITTSSEEYLTQIIALDDALEHHYQPLIVKERALTRQIVSFQANKEKPFYRWYKYKEAFSAELVAYLLRTYRVAKGALLDPFAGVGTTLFTASQLGYATHGIELLPIGQYVMSARQFLSSHSPCHAELALLKRWRDEKPWQQMQERKPLCEFRITKGAYPPETRTQIEQYLAAVEQTSDAERCLLVFALLCILESVSYTRKDGQYLRWDTRSGRNVGKKPFDKGRVWSFEEALVAKLREMITDIENNDDTYTLFRPSDQHGEVRILNGSCLTTLPKLPSATYTAILTSPPYCNRYDYTRTYALELALLGVSEEELVRLRQTMLSCTVENREKDLLAMQPAWKDAINITDQQMLLQEILRYLEYQRQQKQLNNSGIFRMVKGYFYEMACVIAECSRVLRPDGLMLMVNDNVRYAGASISVDLILSNIAEGLGFMVEHILVLPQEKGNSSQQMGDYGRTSLRKCVYVWRKNQ